VEQRSKVEILFNSFDVEDHLECMWDNVTIYEGSYPVAGPYCGQNNPAPYESMGNLVRVEFISDQIVTHPGFQMSYECLANPTTPGPVECGGFLKKSSGTVTSPGWPDVYPNNANCFWKIRCPKKKRVEITFDSFHLENAGDEGGCEFDNVTIYDGPDSGAPTFGTFCGTDIPSTYTSSGRYAAVVFISDISEKRQGFEMSYTCKKPCKDKKKTSKCEKLEKKGKCTKKKVWKKCKKTCGKC